MSTTLKRPCKHFTLSSIRQFFLIKHGSKSDGRLKHAESLVLDSRTLGFKNSGRSTTYHGISTPKISTLNHFLREQETSSSSESTTLYSREFQFQSGRNLKTERDMKLIGTQELFGTKQSQSQAPSRLPCLRRTRDLGQTLSGG
jgi:hypothetical protein